MYAVAELLGRRIHVLLLSSVAYGFSEILNGHNNNNHEERNESNYLGSIMTMHARL